MANAPFNRRTILAAITAVVVPWPRMLAHAMPSAPAPFDMATFETALRKHSVVVVETYANWCLPCRIQGPLLNTARARPKNADSIVLRIGEKSPKPIWKRFGLKAYGVIIVFREGREVARGSPTEQADMDRLFGHAG